ncbi:hypothetical protein F2Q69_00014016 [Brassica cretica]|uniref:Uncharacterized protein n=1 Tax=Brassica cretica TaxID=69181 RepID=A0A8S9QX66_BRACR|nr:hypothetical protein F2Q69_00014016 [Brassica cretica]
MSFGRSHWCRSTPATEHRSTYTNSNRSTGVPENRSTTPTKSTTSCNAIKILTHEEFAAKHPHPPSPEKGFYWKNSKEKKGKSGETSEEGANEKEKENFQKRVFRIPLNKPFEEAYYSHRLWMFFRETREKEEDIRRMFCEAREKMRKRITLKKKSDPGQFAIPCTVQVGAVCNLQTNQLCLTLIDPNAHYDPIPVKKPQTISRRINDPGIIAACHCGDEYCWDQNRSRRNRCPKVLRKIESRSKLQNPRK